MSPLFSSGNKNLTLPSPDSGCHWLTQVNQRWGHKWFWQACKTSQGDLLDPTILFLITIALTANVYKPPGCFREEDSHCYWFFLQKKCEIGVTSPPKGLGPESAHWTFALNMQLPRGMHLCYSQVYLLTSKVKFKAQIAVTSTLNSRRCSEQVFILQAHTINQIHVAKEIKEQK